MNEQIEADIRRLLKTFGVQSDRAIREYLENNPQIEALNLRIVLEDRTDYEHRPASPLRLEVSGEIRREAREK
ncbi:MAG TPA: hypothetical protein GYA06_13930 [Chloroflexi bacterium]|nr:hypothetical protein [Chloroflexota bacterium]